jgi:hypothetical protein
VSLRQRAFNQSARSAHGTSTGSRHIDLAIADDLQSRQKWARLSGPPRLVSESHDRFDDHNVANALELLITRSSHGAE